jgi:hypothetical protein
MRKFLIAIGLLSVLAVPASGADALGCFTRVYDRAHLARHPDQLVTAVKLRIKRPPPDNLSKYWFDFEVRVRGKDKALHTSGICDEKVSGMHCFVECDGGSVEISHRGGHVMMYLNDRIRVAECGKELMDDGSGEELRGGKDDRVFRLDRVNDAVCRRMEP